MNLSTHFTLAELSASQTADRLGLGLLSFLGMAAWTQFIKGPHA